MQLQLDKALKLQERGDFAKAKEIYHSLLSQAFTKDLIVIYYQLGNIAFREQDYTIALNYFQQALTLNPEFLEAFYNTGLCYFKLNQAEQAKQQFEKILAKYPQHSLTLQQMARLFYFEKNYRGAIKCYERLNLISADFSHYYNIATSYLQLNEFEKAYENYQRALVYKENDSDALFNLGVIDMLTHHAHAAINYFLKILQQQPLHAAALQNLAILYLKAEEKESALRYLNKLRKANPDNKTAIYLISALQGEQNFSHAPAEYLRDLFNYYAGYFEQHLINSLHYTLPKLLAELFRRLFGMASQQFVIVEIGCGTGLAGESIVPWTKSLIGIDLSEKMLELAKQKEIYQQLFCGDFLDELKQISYFDIILSADTFVYSGDLTLAFETISQKLTPGGWLIFNTEIAKTDDYDLLETGRFSHHPSYIETLAQQHQLEVIEKQFITPRQQEGELVSSLLWALQKN